MGEVYGLLRKAYPENIDIPISVKEICQSISHSEGDVLEALYYLAEMHVWSYKSNGFPYEEHSSITASENVLRQKALSEMFDNYYQMRFISPAIRTVTTQELGQPIKEEKRKSFIGRIWHDPVGSKIIASVIFAGLAWAYLNKTPLIAWFLQQTFMLRQH